jgi:putative ABC transport system substrate-binding protein
MPGCPAHFLQIVRCRRIYLALHTACFSEHLSPRSPRTLSECLDPGWVERAEAILILGSPILISQRKRFVELVTKSRLPAIYGRSEFVEDGGLTSYGASLTDLYRRVATYVDKILKGAKPADLPVEQPTKFEMVINLKAAKQIGITIPPNVLARA